MLMSFISPRIALSPITALLNANELAPPLESRSPPVSSLAILPLFPPSLFSPLTARLGRAADWFRALFWKEEMELTLVGLQASGKSTFVDVVACGSVRVPVAYSEAS